MPMPALTPDCGQCAALCCIGLAFDRSDLFAYDKLADEPCRHLTADDRCAIHDRLEAAGFGGCVQFDCQGAGQRVIQEVFGGRSWRDDASLLRPMMDAFRVLWRIHGLLALLAATAGLPLDRAQSARREELTEALNPADGWTARTLSEFERSHVADDVQAFLTGLRELAAKHVAPG